MAKKQRNTYSRNQVNRNKTTATSTKQKRKETNKQTFPVPDFLDSRYNPFIFAIILVLSFALYANSIQNLYTLDDGIVITKNDFTQQGLKGIMDILGYDTFAGEHGKEINLVAGGRYRPLSVVTFAIEWELFAKETGKYQLTDKNLERIKSTTIPEADYNRLFAVKGKEYASQSELQGDLRILFGENAAMDYLPIITQYAAIKEGDPHLSHAINILLYAITGMLIYIVLRKIFAQWYTENNSRTAKYQRWFFSVPFVATLLYVAHPVHTEIVANIKGRDEIMTFMGALAALWFTIRYVETKNFKYLIFSSLTFFLALLSKENAITFLAIIPLTVYFFVERKWSNNITALIPLFILTLVFLAIRRSILGDPPPIPAELMNDPFVDATKSERYGTIFFTYLWYFKLLIFPHPLTWDYYPYHVPLLGWEDGVPFISLLIHIGLGWIAIKGLKTRTPIAYGIWFYIASFSIVSNFFFSIGVFMSERFLYISSLGFCIVLVFLLFETIPAYLQSHKAYTLAVGGIMTIVLVLFGVKIYNRNFAWKDNFTLFNTDVLISTNSAKSNTTAGEQLIIRGIDPAYKTKKDEYLALSIKYLTKAVEIHPRYIAALLDLGVAHEKYNENYDTALYYYSRVVSLNPTYEKAFNNINVIFTNYQNTDKQIETYENLYKYNPNRFDVNYTLGTSYGAYRNDIDKAVAYLEKAVQVAPPTEPRLVNALSDLGTAYAMKQRYDDCIRVLERAVALTPTGPLVYDNLSRAYEAVGNMGKSKYYKQIADEKRGQGQQNQ